MSEKVDKQHQKQNSPKRKKQMSLLQHEGCHCKQHHRQNMLLAKQNNTMYYSKIKNLRMMSLNTEASPYHDAYKVFTVWLLLLTELNS